MNEEHLKAQGGHCKDKHLMFHWQGLWDNRACLVCDSLGKWVRGVSHLEVKSFPGITLADMIEKIEHKEIAIDGYEALLFLAGTNDFENACSDKLPTAEIVQLLWDRVNALIVHLKEVVPNTRIGISMILPRPKDTKPKLDEDRREINTALKALCKSHKVAFLNTYRGVKTAGVFDKGKYALDNLHLNQHGLAGISAFLRGATAGLLKKVG